MEWHTKRMKENGNWTGLTHNTQRDRKKLMLDYPDFIKCLQTHSRL